MYQSQLEKILPKATMIVGYLKKIIFDFILYEQGYKFYIFFLFLFVSG